MSSRLDKLVNLFEDSIQNNTVSKWLPIRINRSRSLSQRAEDISATSIEMYIIVVCVWLFLGFLLVYFVYNFVKKKLKIRKQNKYKRAQSKKREEALKELVQQSIVIGKCIEQGIPKFESVVRSTFNLEYQQNLRT